MISTQKSEFKKWSKRAGETSIEVQIDLDFKGIDFKEVIDKYEKIFGYLTFLCKIELRQLNDQITVILKPKGATSAAVYGEMRGTFSESFIQNVVEAAERM